MLFQKHVPIVDHLNVAPGYFRMGLAFPELARLARPGQFVMVKRPGRRIPLLRRPFSVHNCVAKQGEICGFELLYKVVGQGTQALSEMKAGDVLDVLGPLGKGFSYSADMGHAFLVAGGVGVASLYYLGTELAKHGVTKSTVFLGGCSAADILCLEQFQSLGTEVFITTEDCTLGERGIVTPLVQEAVEIGGKPDMIYACGPMAMLRAVSHIAANYDIACQISLETVMACGFGVCLGCAVRKAAEPGSYFHACTDGPVFDSRDVRI
jgi:dihydroorotate dehydrogenase electron transfer subunit